MMKALRFHEFGQPIEVLRLEDLPTPEPSADEVLVRLTARSVNPSDLYTIMGVYGVLPSLPAVPGNEASGVVERAGANVTAFKPGDRVTLLLGAVGMEGTWREYAAAASIALVPSAIGLILRAAEAELTTTDAAMLYLLGEKYILALDRLAASGNSKIVVLPADLQDTLRGILGRART